MVEEVVPMVGVPEALLSDRGTNLVTPDEGCVWITWHEKLNTTAHCNGLVERFNRTLIEDHDQEACISYMDWYGHTEIPQKPSFLLLGMDCRYPSEAALLPPNDCNPALVEDYPENLATCSHFGSGRNRSIRLVMAERLPTKWESRIRSQSEWTL